MVHHDDLSRLLVEGPAQPVGDQRSAGAATQDHDPLHMITLRLGRRLAAGAFVPPRVTIAGTGTQARP
jgi:hypothetical protein